MEDKSAAERKAKQNFLREEIIEKNFETEVFVSYCEKLKGADIDLWTLEELETCVSDFKILYSHLGSSGENQNANSQECTFDTISCQEIPPSELTGQLTKIILSNPDPILDKKAATSHLDYNVMTLPLGWLVKRKYPDFVWLRDTLAIQFPSYYIPNLPNKKCKVKISALQLDRQKKYLEIFMSSLISSDLIKRSQIFVGFLKEEKNDDFKEFKKQASKIRKSTNLAGYVSSDGYINCEYTPSEEYFQRMDTYLTSHEDIMKRLSKEAVNIINLTNSLSSSISTYAELVKGLENLGGRLTSQQKLAKTLYGKVSETCTKWAEATREQTTLFNEYLVGLMKYVSQQSSPLIDLFKEKEQAYQEFIKVNTKKQKLVEKSKPVKSDLLNLLSMAKQRFGILNNQAKVQCEKTTQSIIRLIFSEFCEFSTKITESTNKQQASWVMLIDGLDTCKPLL